ncbi:hypothetical protein M5689_004358 [Euphorbia peplus]|nr:hypothetical protein M5689_004358 [Euphorbia peplus]
MASTSSLFSSSIIIFSFIVTTSAADYGSYTPETVKSKPNNVYSPKQTLENTKPDYRYGPKPKSLDIKFKSEVNVIHVPKPN